MKNFTPDMNDGTNIFVFGSNLAGRHGKGAALEAVRYWGALYGVPYGPQGQSYAIPTKNELLEPLPLKSIEYHIEIFNINALACLNKYRFLVTPVGCGLAGYSLSDIAPLFDDSLSNCVFAWSD